MALTETVGALGYRDSNKLRTSISNSADGHADQATQAMARLCSALGALLESLPSHPTRATDVASAIGVNPQLAWQVFRMAGAANALAAVQFLPTSNQLARVIEAARASGAKPGVVKRAKEASDAIDAFLIEHEMDRREFESLIGSLAAGGAEQVDIKHRRALHRSHAHYYGIQSKTVYSCSILHPGGEGESYRQVSLLGYVNLHALRPNVSMTLFQTAAACDPDGARVPTASTPCLLEGFDAGRSVELVHEGEEDGRVFTRIVFPGIGRGAAVSFLTMQTHKDGNTAQDPHPWITVQLTVPAEAIVLDILVPTAWGTSGQAVVRTYARRAQPMKVLECRSVDIVPCNEQATCTREVTELSPTADAPGVREAIGRMLRKKGWGQTKFDLYRCRVAFPVLYSAIHLRVLPQEG